MDRTRDSPRPSDLTPRSAGCWSAGRDISDAEKFDFGKAREAIGILGDQRANAARNHRGDDVGVMEAFALQIVAEGEVPQRACRRLGFVAQLHAAEEFPYVVERVVGSQAEPVGVHQTRRHHKWSYPDYAVH